MDGRPSFPVVYTMKGTSIGALFHGECITCKVKYYPNYHTAKEGERIYIDPANNNFFQVTSKTVFEKNLLKDISNNVWIAGTTFESRARVYNKTFCDDDNLRLCNLKEFIRSSNGEWTLNEQRVIDAFFLWIIIEYYSIKGSLAETVIHYNYSSQTKHLNTEQMCEYVWKDINSCTNKWIQHTCKTPGCTEGYVTIDGNEYLKRSKCAIPIEKLKPRKDLPQIVLCCTNSPLPGGKNQVASKLCAVHQNQESASIASEVPLPPEFDGCEHESRLLPEDNPTIVNEVNKGCRKKRESTLFFESTAGMLALIRPCGVVVSMTEMFTSESFTQVFLFLLRTFGANVEDIQRLKYLGYDRACGLVPYLRNQARNGSAGAWLLLNNVKYLVDIFHVSKHTEAVCMPPENPHCLYHPSLPIFKDIHGTNTESCEQGFRRLNQYQQLTRKMTQFKRNVLFWFVNEKFNSDLESQLKQKELL